MRKLPIKPEEVSPVIVQVGAVMTDKEIDSELASLPSEARRALTQLIADQRDGYALEAAGQARVNNALGMSSGNGAYEALTRLIQILNDRSIPSD